MNQPGALLLAMLVAGAASAAASAQDQDEGQTSYYPQQLSARELLLHCASSSLTDRGRQRQRYCAGFVSGVEEAARLLLNTQEDGPAAFCVPRGESARGLKDAYVLYAGRRGSDLEKPAALVVMDALGAAYPCQP